MNIKSPAKAKKTKYGQAKQKRPPKKISETYLHNAGLYYLQRFAASSGQFRKVMMRKVKKSCLHHPDQDYEICQSLVEALVDKFEKAGLLNDESYTAGTVHSLRQKGKSKKSIQSKLLIKGVNPDLIDTKLADYDDTYGMEAPETELKAALTLARKRKIGPYRTTKDYNPEKELATLARAGFSYEIARKVLLSEENPEN